MVFSPRAHVSGCLKNSTHYLSSLSRLARVRLLAFRRNFRRKHLLVCIVWLLGLFILLTLYKCRFDDSDSYKDLQEFEYPPDVDLDIIIGRSRANLQPLYPPLPNLQPSNPRRFPFMLGDLTVCRQQRIELLVLVKTTHAATGKRAGIRTTWGKRNCFAPLATRVLFLLGRSVSQRQEEKIRREQETFGDLLMQSFHDHYYNNTLKLMMGFEFFVHYCRKARFLVLLDDDYLVNPITLTAYITSVHQRLLGRFLAGHVWYNSMPIRDSSSKWFESRKSYPYRYFPNYAEAGTLIVSAEMAHDLYIAMQYTKFHPFDDVFLGIVMHKLHIAPIHCPGVLHNRPKKFKKDFISCHEFNRAADMRATWRKIGLDRLCAQVSVKDGS